MNLNEAVKYLWREEKGEGMKTGVGGWGGEALDDYSVYPFPSSSKAVSIRIVVSRLVDVYVCVCVCVRFLVVHVRHSLERVCVHVGCVAEEWWLCKGVVG